MEHALRYAGQREVPDRITVLTGFEQVLDLVEDACDGFVRQLGLQLRGAPDAAPREA